MFPAGDESVLLHLESVLLHHESVILHHESVLTYFEGRGHATKLHDAISRVAAINASIIQGSVVSHAS